MPRRKTIFATGEAYHVFNRSVAKLPIFINQKDYQRLISLINFYSYPKPPLRYSHFNRLTPENKQSFLNSLNQNQKRQVSILSFCIMPNHLHFLLIQRAEAGIINFLRNLQNSYAKYFNTKYDRSGSVFQEQFRAKRIETSELLLHTARYIHLNPITSYIIEKPEDLVNYKWSSYPDYLGVGLNDFVDRDIILKEFGSVAKFNESIFNQADYQRQLRRLKHLILE